MIEVRTLEHLESAEFHRLIIGYVSDARLAVKRTVSQEGWAFELEFVPRTPPYYKHYDHLNAGTIADYQRMLLLGFSLAAYEGTQCVGLAIADISQWNRTYWVHEFHAAPTHQRRGVGSRLIAALEARGRAAGLRTLLCETQNTNVPALRFYQKMGFSLEGLDLSHYRNTDFPDGEIAVLMKKPLGP